MAQYTRKAIISSFVELLDERPLNKITVKDIVLRSGVNRNTFYYYFNDLSALAEAVVIEQAQSFVEETDSLNSVEEYLDTMITFILDHKQVVYHLYNSTDREQYELAQWRVCQKLSEHYIGIAIKNRKISDEDQKFLVDYLRGSMFGWVMDWLQRGLTPEFRAQAVRMCQLKERQLEEVLDRCEQEWRSKNQAK